MWKRRLPTCLAIITALACVLLPAIRLGIVHLPGSTHVAPSSQKGWTTQGVNILTPTGKPFVIAGVSWYGFETPQYVPFGLDIRDYKDILDQARNLQFNTVRISLSNEMWETNPIPSLKHTRACSACQAMTARDILALIINYAGSIGLHVILDNHRSDAGTSTATNGLWYDTSNGLRYSEQAWIRDWVDIQRWVHGQPSSLGLSDTITVHDTASDGFPTVIGYDLRNEPHTPPGAPYMQGATWGTGDGIDPRIDPNPNPFTPACVATTTCHDWRLAAERAGDSILGDAVAHGWPAPLIFVQGISGYPTAAGTAGKGPYDIYRWGGELAGVNGNAKNPGAPIVLNAGGTALRLGPAVADHLVYVTRDYGPDLSVAEWFTSATCYRLGCAPKGSGAGLVDLWCREWAFIDLVPGRYGTCTGGIAPQFWTAQTWKHTGAVPYTQAPLWIGEFGTGNGEMDLTSHIPGSQGQWFTDLINFIESSYDRTASNDSGLPVHSLNWTYWALNADDSYALLGAKFTGLANPAKQFSFLCFIDRSTPPATDPPQPCGSTGDLPPAH